MEPKDKAKELRDKYLNVRWDIGLDDAKQCALIAVNEILKLQLNDGYDHEFWQEVKQEIEKL